MMVILPLLSGLAGAVIGAGGIIVSQIIANKHARLENDKQRATEAAIRLTELAASKDLVDPIIPATNNDNFAMSYIRLLQIIQSR